MKLHLFFCISILSFFTVSKGLAEEITFSGQFLQGSSYSEYHYFVLEEDSVAEVKINSSCSVQGVLFEGDANDDGTFESAYLGVTAPVNETWYGFFPLAGGVESERDYLYRVRLNCPDYYDGEAYSISLRYTAGASEGFTKDQEPNNNRNTATDMGRAAGELLIDGHLGFYFNTRETYNNTVRDGLDYYSVEFPAGRYTLLVQLDNTLLTLDPYLPEVSIRTLDGFDTIFSGSIVDGTTIEFNIVTSGIYTVSTLVYDTNTNADRPYGGYRFTIIREVDLQLFSIEADDNVCGNIEAVRGSVENHSGTTFTDTDYKIAFEVIGPFSTTYNDDVEISSFPPGTTRFTYNFAIPENFISGDYTYYFNLLECYNRDPDGACLDWAPTHNNRVYGSYSILCKPRRNTIIGILNVLLGKPK